MRTDAVSQAWENNRGTSETQQPAPAKAAQTALEAKLKEAQQGPVQKTAGRPAGSQGQPSGQAQHSGGNWFTRGMGVLQAGVGVVETVGGAAFGIATSETGIGAVAGGAVALHGLDDIQAGIRQAWSGETVQNFTMQATSGAALKLGATPATAMIIGMGVDIAAGGGLGSGEKAAVKGLAEGGKLLEEGGKILEDGSKVLETGSKIAEDGGKALTDVSKVEKGLQDAGKTGEVLAKSGVIAAKAEKAAAVAAEHFPGGVAPKILNPKLTEKVHELRNAEYSVTYSGVSRTPLVSSEHLTKEAIERAATKGKRANDFRADMRLPADQRAELSDYKGYVNSSRGHMAPNSDMSTRAARQQLVPLVEHGAPSRQSEHGHLGADRNRGARSDGRP